MHRLVLTETSSALGYILRRHFIMCFLSPRPRRPSSDVRQRCERVVLLSLASLSPSVKTRHCLAFYSYPLSYQQSSLTDIHRLGRHRKCYAFCLLPLHLHLLFLSIHAYLLGLQNVIIVPQDYISILVMSITRSVWLVWHSYKKIYNILAIIQLVKKLCNCHLL